MNSIARTAKPFLSLRFAASALIVMLGATALLSGEDSVLNTIAWLTLAWPLLMVVLASHVLRLLLAEHSEYQFEPEIKVESWLSSSGLHLVPVMFTHR